MKKIKLFLFTLWGICYMQTAFSQTPSKVEYFLDEDPGYGQAQTINNINVDGNKVTFNLQNAKWGAHVLYMRAQDSEGHWSTTVSRPLFIDRYQDIVYVEYFFDKDPGVGLGKAIQLPDQSYKAHLTMDLQMDISNLTLGEHKLFVRARDRFDQWTDVLSRSFTIVQGGITPEDPPQTAGDLSQLEYFFDTDPGYGLASKLMNPKIGKNIYQMDFTEVTDGAHVLYIRAQDTNGQWSSTLYRPIYIYRPLSKVVALEYFFDNADPGVGKATAVTLPGENTNEFTFDLDISSLAPGNHQLCVRVCDGDNHWSLLRIQPFELVGEGMDIQNVVWTLQVGMAATTTECRLNSNSDRGNCHVEVVNAAGMCLTSTDWPATNQQLTLPINAHRGEVVIIRVTDTDNNRTVLRKIRID